MIIIGLGANLPSIHGAPPETLRAAMAEIEQRGIRILQSSSVYETSPVPVSDQPLYYNAVAKIDTALPVHDLLALLHSIEEEFGRTRHIKDEPRILDLDVLAYNDNNINERGVVVPHPRMHERGFVLIPLHEIAPNWTHPVTGLDLQTLIDALPNDQDVRIVPQKAA